MDYTYNYYQMYQKEAKFDEFGSTRLSYQSPYQVFLYEILIFYLNGLAPYLIKLKEFGITNKKIEEDTLETMSTAIVNVEYRQEQFFKIITILYDDMIQARDLYMSVCQKNNLEIKIPKQKLKDPRNLSFSDIIKQGQQLFNIKYTKLTPDQINFIEMYLNIVKSVIIHLVELRRLGGDDEKAYESLLVLFSYKNRYAPLMRKVLMEITKNLVETDNRLLIKIYEIKKEKYGEIEPTKISTSTKPNKAILVSGSNLKELELLLEATKGKGIDVYTHGFMLSANAYPKFKTYPHLVGHFGGELENYLFDFAKFPGAIFLTRHSFLDISNFYRGRLYTTDLIAPQGVIIIKDDNFEPLIQSALRAEGFEEPIEKPPIEFNFSENQFFDKVTEITQKIEEREIKYFFALQAANLPTKQKEYFEELLALLNKDCFILSISCFLEDSYIELDYEFYLFYKALKILTRKISIEQFNPVMLFTRCGENMFSNINYMKMLGIKKIYLPDCSPNLFNPAVINFIRNKFDVKNYTAPEDDIKDMLA